MFSVLLKFLLISIAVLWAFRLIARLVFPWALKKAAEKLMNQQQQHHQQQYRGQRESQRSSETHTDADGNIQIDFVPPKTKPRTGPQRAGEFVEFEEVR